MTNFIKLCNELIALHEQNEPALPVGAQVAKEFLEKASSVFSADSMQSEEKKEKMEKLYAQIGQQKVEIDWLKKKLQ